MALPPGSWLAELWTPTGAVVEEWATFVNFSLVSLIAVSVTIYVFYKSRLHQKVKLEQSGDVFKLRGPWLSGLTAALVIQLLSALICTTFAISELSGQIFAGAFYVGFLEGVIAAGLYVFFSRTIGVPARVKYVHGGRSKVRR